MGLDPGRSKDCCGRPPFSCAAELPFTAAFVAVSLSPALINSLQKAIISRPSAYCIPLLSVIANEGYVFRMI